MMAEGLEIWSIGPVRKETLSHSKNQEFSNRSKGAKRKVTRMQHDSKNHVMLKGKNDHIVKL